MEDKSYMIIDDEDQETRMEQKINKILRPDGYNIKSIYVNPIDRDFEDTNRDFDQNKFLAKIKELTSTYHINVIACDYEYGGIAKNGIDIIGLLRENGFNSCPIILYSGKEAKIAKDFFNREDLSEHDKIELFVKLIKCKIYKFLQRDTYPDTIIELLKSSYDFKEIVLKKLEEYSDSVINLDSGFFQGRRFEEVIHEIKNNSLQGNKFVGEILELAISQYANYNNE